MGQYPRDGRPAEYRWRPLFNAAKFGWRRLLECRAVTLPRRETRWNLHGWKSDVDKNAKRFFTPMSSYFSFTLKGDFKQSYSSLFVFAITFFNLSLFCLTGISNGTRMLAINVSIPNLTVAHLEQFRPPQLYESRESDQETQGLTENNLSFIRNPHVVIFRRRPFAAIM